MAEFFAYRIIKGQTTYAKVPQLLKTRVAEILTEEGFQSLITEMRKRK